MTYALPISGPGPDQADVDAIRELLDLMADFSNNDQRARHLLTSNWMRDRGGAASTRLHPSVDQEEPEDSTGCPSDTKWCEQHQVLEPGVERCIRWLFSRYAPVQPAVPLLALYVQHSPASPWGPSLALRQYDDPPQRFDPEEARRLAAALIRGAQIVEDVCTATCPACARRVAPAELQYADEDTGGEAAGVCLTCLGARLVAARKSRREALKAVPFDVGGKAEMVVRPT